MNNFNAQIKPALTFNQQLDHLINDKGLIVNNYDNALSILKHENYYRLSGYMIDFLDKNDNFIDNISPLRISIMCIKLIKKLDQHFLN